MKLNLLPTYVSKEGQQKTFIALAVLLLLLSIGAAAFMVISARTRLDESIAKSKEPENNYKSALAYSAKADEVILKATDADRHIKLANQMNAHNTVYTELYRRIYDFVPGFMRVRSISAVPVDAQNATVTMTAVLRTYQQYADATMALLRIEGPFIGFQPEGAAAPAAAPTAAPTTPGAAAAPAPAAAATGLRVVNVTRSGYTINDRFVPSLNELDQLGTPIRPGESNLPSDPNERWREQVARAMAQPDPYAFQGIGDYGTTSLDRGAMPEYSEVTFVIQLSGVNLQTPDPRATIMSGAAGGGGPVGAATVPGAARGATPPPGGGGTGVDDDD
jgi:hypothetical protein